MKKLNTWNGAKIFFNKRFGQVVTRKEFQKLVLGPESTKDTYRMLLTAAGFLYSIKPGHYLVQKMIPFNLSTGFTHTLGYKTDKINWIFWLDKKQKVIEESERLRQLWIQELKKMETTR